MALTAQQLELRRFSIGGSDAAAALGLSPWKTPYELFLEKSGRELPRFETEPQYWGSVIERVILERYMRDHPDRLVVTSQHMAHKDYDWMTCTPDATTIDRLIEIKTARSYSDWGKSGTQEIPEDYMLQVQHNLAVTGMPVADVLALIGGSDYRTYEIPADAELQALIIEGERQFWKRVQDDDPPDPQWENPSTRNLIKIAYPGTTGEVLSADEGMEKWYATYLEASEKEKTYKEAATAAMNHMLYSMGEAAILKFSGGKDLRRKLTKRKGYTVADTEYMDARFVNRKE